MVWALARVNARIDLVETKAKYHTGCRLKFEVHDQQRTGTKGRKPTTNHMDSFNEACRWLELESIVHTMKEFRGKVQEYLGEEQAYQTHYLKVLLKNKYGASITFTAEKGNFTLICLNAGLAKNKPFASQETSSEGQTSFGRDCGRI